MHTITIHTSSGNFAWIHTTAFFFLSKIVNCFFLFWITDESSVSKIQLCTTFYLEFIIVSVLFAVIFIKMFRAYDWLKTTSYRSIYRDPHFIFFIKTDKKTEFRKFITISVLSSFKFSELMATDVPSLKIIQAHFSFEEISVIQFKIFCWWFSKPQKCQYDIIKDANVGIISKW